MDHRYIDEFDVAERYLKHALQAEERAAFEAHVVDCQECADRLLLAEMFYARNGLAHPSTIAPAPVPLPLRAKFAAALKPWQLIVIFVISALLLLAIPTAIFSLWEHGRLPLPR